MNQPTLPNVDPKMFTMSMTVAGAAEKLGVSRATVTRMVDRGLLNQYWPICGRRERGPLLLSSAEVEQLRAARDRAGVTGRAPADPCANGCPDAAAHAEGGHDV